MYVTGTKSQQPCIKTCEQAVNKLSTGREHQLS